MDLATPRYSQPSGTLSRATLINQTCGAFPYEGFEALTAVGVVVKGLRGCSAIYAGGQVRDLGGMQCLPICCMVLNVLT